MISLFRWTAQVLLIYPHKVVKANVEHDAALGYACLQGNVRLLPSGKVFSYDASCLKPERWHPVGIAPELYVLYAAKED